jgi:hypothetical protein
MQKNFNKYKANPVYYTKKELILPILSNIKRGKLFVWATRPNSRVCNLFFKSSTILISK